MSDDAQQRVAELAGRHLDGDLDAAGVNELNALLAADPEARRVFARAVAYDTALPRALPRARILRWWPALAAAAVLVLALAGWWLLAAPAGPALDPGADAVVLRSGRELAPAAAGTLRRDDAVRAGPGGATVRWPEGTSAELAGGATLAIADPGPRKDLELRDGAVTVEAAPQAGGRSLGVRAGRLAIAVVGTRFRVASHDGAASVAVEHGRVSVSSGGSSRAVDAGQELIAGASGEPVLAPAAGAVLDAAAWDAVQGRDWIGTRLGDGLAARVEATAERVECPERLAGYARLTPGLAITADVELAQPATLALFIICRLPDGRDWLGNYTVQEKVGAGRQRRSWTLADLHVEKGAALPAALGGRIVKVAVCAWNKPVGLVVHRVVVGAASVP